MGDQVETYQGLRLQLEAMRKLYESARDGMRQLGNDLEAARIENTELRIAMENHNSGSKQLAKWLEESRLEAMEAKRQAASDRARVRMMRVDLKQLLEGHRKHGITGLFLAIEEFLQKAVELDR